MSEYRRCYHSGGYYFFTLVTYKRQPIFANYKNIKHFKNAISKIKKKYPFHLNAFVILPDHIHILLKLPQSDHDFSTRLRLMKRYFSTQINTSINHRQEKRIWQRQFWEHVIRNEKDWQTHMDYIHYNPVKHGFVKKPKDWQYSSFSYWNEKGIYQENWGSDHPIIFQGMDQSE